MRINLPTPPSVNALYRNVNGRGRVKSSAYKAWLIDADAYFLVQKRRLTPVNGQYELAIKVPNVRGDIDNRIKAISDFLVSREITPDDRHCQRVSVERDAGMDCCRVEIIERVGA
jgi:crossover junction endodeoxyribonuclease RusA